MRHSKEEWTAAILTTALMAFIFMLFNLNDMSAICGIGLFIILCICIVLLINRKNLKYVFPSKKQKERERRKQENYEKRVLKSIEEADNKLREFGKPVADVKWGSRWDYGSYRMFVYDDNELLVIR